MKKFKKIFVVLASLLIISTSAVAGVRNNMPSVTIASAEESTNESVGKFDDIKGQYKFI